LDVTTTAQRSGDSLKPLFRPNAVAVVGATPDLAKPGGRCLRFLREFGFAGDLYAINPKYEQIDDVPCFPEIEAAPPGIDLVILILPAPAVPAMLRRAAACGTRAAIVCSAGFSEAGREGAALEQELIRAARATGLAVLGPNSLGLLDMNGSLAATFSTVLQADFEPAPGPIALVSQSGAMGAAIYGLAQMEGVGVGTFVSTGNEAVLGLADYIRYFAESPDTRVILGYLEGIGDGLNLVAAARYARERGKIVAVLKAGLTEAGARAAKSHTGALAGSAAVFEAAFRRAGILTARSPRELLDIGVACSSDRLPSGVRVGIATMSGGAGAITSDRLAQLGMEVSSLSDETESAMRQLMPGFAAIGNPVDYGGIYTDPDRIESVVRTLAADPNIDSLLCFIGLSPLMLGVLDDRLERIRRDIAKPVVATWLAGPPSGVRSLRERGIPAYEDPIRTADALANMYAAARPLPVEPDRVRSVLAPAVAELLQGGREVLGERVTKRLLAAYGVPVIEEWLAKTADEADAIARRLGTSVAIKAEADGLLHKSDVGAVALDVDPARVGEAFDRVVAAARQAASGAVHGAIVAPMAPPGGLELLVGVKRDQQFGPVVALGLGGITSEALADVTLELAPLTKAHARAMCERLRGRSLLHAFRGAPERDLEALVDLLVAVGQLAVEVGPRLAELDCNPVVVYPKGEGCLVLDAAAVLAIPEEDGETYD
jgi:acyl-CoA synthetase (NDP forming)